MTDNYTKIVLGNLVKLYSNLPENLEKNVPCKMDGEKIVFEAFGEKCEVTPSGITLGDEAAAPILGILISLYLLNSKPDLLIKEPFKAFKEFPDTMPYTGAFATHTERILIPQVDKIKNSMDKISEKISLEKAPDDMPGDFAFVVNPLPKISLCYIFYEADEDFDASVICLFSNNAYLFLPPDGLADVGEYTSKIIIDVSRL